MKRQKDKKQNVENIKVNDKVKNQLTEEELQKASGGSITDIIKETVSCPTPVR